MVQTPSKSEFYTGIRRVQKLSWVGYTQMLIMIFPTTQRFQHRLSQRLNLPMMVQRYQDYI